MAETSDYTPSSYWEGHDYTESRRDYDVHAGRSYSEAKQSSKSEKDLVTPELTTESEDPFAFVSRYESQKLYVFTVVSAKQRT